MANQPRNDAKRPQPAETPAPVDAVIARATGQMCDQALAVLMSARGLEKAAAVRRFRRFAREQSLSLDGIWVAIRQDRPVATVLVVPSAGRTGMMFLSPVLSGEQVAIAAHANTTKRSIRQQGA